MNDSMSTKR